MQALPAPSADEADRQARAAVRARVRQALVLITFGQPGTRTSFHGSGTLIAGADGRVWVLTAKHVVEDPSEPLAIVTLTGAFHHAAERRVPAPGRRRSQDVALVLLSERVGAQVHASALPPHQLEDSEAHQIDEDDVLLVAGFPVGFRHDARATAERGPVTLDRFTEFLRWTSGHRHDHELISLPWPQGEIAWTGVDASRLAQTSAARKPSGLSGGPVLRVARTRPGSLWSPTNDLRLIGVATEFASSRELAVPWWCWRDWLLATVGEPKLDRVRQ